MAKDTTRYWQISAIACARKFKSAVDKAAEILDRTQDAHNGDLVEFFAIKLKLNQAVVELEEWAKEKYTNVPRKQSVDPATADAATDALIAESS